MTTPPRRKRRRRRPCRVTRRQLGTGLQLAVKGVFRPAQRKRVGDLEDQTAPGNPELQHAQARLERLFDQAAALGLRAGVVAEVDTP